MSKHIIDITELHNKRVRPKHKYPPQTRQLLVELCSPRLDADGGESPALVDVDDLRVIPSAPSRATMFKWLAGIFAEDGEPQPVVQHDFSSVLNEWQELVVIGFCLFTFGAAIARSHSSWCLTLSARTSARIFLTNGHRIFLLAITLHGTARCAAGGLRCARHARSCSVLAAR
jgi:hypothetical protein